MQTFSKNNDAVQNKSVKNKRVGGESKKLKACVFGLRLKMFMQEGASLTFLGKQSHTSNIQHSTNLLRQTWCETFKNV